MTAEEFAAISNDNGSEPHPTSDGPALQVHNNTHQNGGKNMEFTTPEELRNAFPDIVAQIESAARAEGATAERNRIQEIESVQAAIADTQMIADAKYGEKPMNAQELAFAAMKAQAATGAQVVANMNADAAASGASGVVAAPAQQEETKKMTDDEQAEALLVGAVKNKKEDK